MISGTVLARLVTLKSLEIDVSHPKKAKFSSGVPGSGPRPASYLPGMRVSVTLFPYPVHFGGFDEVISLASRYEAECMRQK